MRTFKLLFCLMLIPFLGNAQSVTVTSTNDSLGSPCVTTGSSVALLCSGESTGLTNNDTVDIYADYGNGPVLEAQSQVSNNYYFWGSWSHTFNTAGAHVIDVIAVGPYGSTDTAQHTIIISDSCSTVQGTAYLDTNNNCYYDNGEPLLSNRHLKIHQGNNMMGYAMTDNAGQYQFDVSTGQTYDITMHDTGSYVNSCPPSGTQSVSNFPAYGVDFGLTCNGSGDFAADYLNPGWFRPDWKTNIYFGFEGTAYCGINASCVKMVLPSSVNAHDSLLYDSAGYSNYTPAFDTIMGDTVVWDLTDTLTINDFNYGVLPVYTDSNAVLGDTLCAKLIVCTSDQDPSNDMLEVCVPVVNSYDPNNKLVLPRGQGQPNYIAPDQQMTYTINFQNTGTAPAVDVRIEDTLSTGELDQGTFKVVSSSHPITQVKVKNNNIIKFYFDDIMLPDSGVSQSASKGYVRFNIDQQPGLSDGTEITNSGAIFFDQNPPIITNEALNTIGTPTSIVEEEGKMIIDVYPNPAEDQLNIASGQMIEGDAVLRDMVGKQVAQKPINGNKTTLDLHDLPGGVYILSIRTIDGKDPVREKVIVK